jgi:Zn-dependent protease with chaperone function
MSKHWKSLLWFAGMMPLGFVPIVMAAPTTLPTGQAESAIPRVAEPAIAAASAPSSIVISPTVAVPLTVAPSASPTPQTIPVPLQAKVESVPLPLVPQPAASRPTGTPVERSSAPFISSEPKPTTLPPAIPTPPSSVKPASDAAAGKPAPEQPASEQPASEQPAADKPASEQPAADKPASEQPAADKPASEQPASEQPAIDKPGDKFIEPIKSSAEIERQKQLTDADRLYKAGDLAAAEAIYRTLKTPFANAQDTPSLPEPMTDPELLSPAGKVFWRESTAGLEQNIESRIFVPLQLLTERVPQFIPGHLRLAETLEARGKADQALIVLEKASAQYPHQPELLKARVAALGKNEKWMEAAIAARQFALLNPTSPLAAEFTTLADENQQQYQRQMRRKLNSNLVGGIITGALSYALTGSLYGPLNAVQATALMLRGESAVGNRVTNQAKRQLKLVDDPEIVGYVDEIGQKLAKVAGRNEFQYEFFVVMDETLNAFALPGGKVFIHLGAIAKTNSEAELAGLLAHELSHTVLSHGFQLMTQGTLTANVTQFIPYVGGLAGNLLVLNYSRDMERQADTLGTRILSSSGYAADGLRNLMVTLQLQEQKKGKNSPPEWASSHPATKERVRYLETLITEGKYNRYAFEGVERHAAMQLKAEKMLWEFKAAEAAKRKEK